MGGPGAPWFEAAAPGLLTARAARNFLGVYPAGDWPEVVKLLALLGIAAVHNAQGGTGPGAAAPVALPELRAMAAEAGRAGIIRRAAQGELAGRLEELRQDLAGAAADADPPPPAVPGIPAGEPLALVQRQRAAERRMMDTLEAEARAGANATVLQQRPTAQISHGVRSRPRRDVGPRVDSGRAATGGLRKKPSAAWRRGYPPAEVWVVPTSDGEVDQNFKDTLGGAGAGMGPTVNPPWWFREGNEAKQPHRHKKVRAEPRLAYTRVIEEQRGDRRGTDDLVTAKYLPVRSSGYGAAKARTEKHRGGTAQAVQLRKDYAAQQQIQDGGPADVSAPAAEEYRKLKASAGSLGHVPPAQHPPAPTCPPAEGRGAIAVADAFLRDPWMHHFSGGPHGPGDDVALARLGRSESDVATLGPEAKEAAWPAAPVPTVSEEKPSGTAALDGVAAGALADLAPPSAEELRSISKHTDLVLTLREKKDLYGKWIGDFKDSKPMTWKPKWRGVEDTSLASGLPIPETEPSASVRAADLSHPALSAQQRKLAGWGPSSNREDFKWDFDQIFGSEQVEA